VGLIKEPYEDVESSFEYDLKTTPLIYIYKNSWNDLTFEEFEDLRSDTHEYYTLSSNFGPPTFECSRDDK
jgi:hypothetical protein